MTTSTKSTIAQLKQAIQAIAEELGVVEDWANGHRGHRETWLNAYAKAQAAQLEFRAAQAAAKEIETEVLTTATSPIPSATVLLTQAKINGGFSVWFNGDKSTGFSVGNNTFSYKIPNFIVDNSLTYDRLCELLEAIETFSASVLADKVNDFDGIGGWVDTETNTLYLDPIRHMEDLGDALQLALENEELAIYALQSGICYNVHGGHNKIDETKYHIDGEPSEISDDLLWYRVYNSETEAVAGYVAQG